MRCGEQRTCWQPYDARQTTALAAQRGAEGEALEPV
jgi:hypothetical protein